MGKKRKLESTGGGPSKTSPTEEFEKHRAKKPVDRSDRSEGDRCSSSDNPVPIRNTGGLYASQLTLNCALNDICVPCAYKIGCFDVALDKEFCKATPNQRPEQCPRSQRNHPTNFKNDGVMGFRRGMSILTVGDGDFSFSLGLARQLMPRLDQQQQHPERNENENERRKSTFLVATSYESQSTLRKVYPVFDETLRELEELGVHVAYNVDATRILETLALTGKASKKTLERRFHRICWNFPCTAIASGQDGQNTAMEENKTLVRNFVESSRSVLTNKGDGELYVCHKTKPPYNQWNLEQIALENQKPDEANDSGAPRPLLYYSGRIVLDRFLIPPYTPRKALDKKSFPCHDACFYVFAQKPTKDTQKTKVFSPTIPNDEDESEERTIESTTTSTTTPPPSTLLRKIDPELIRAIRKKHAGNKWFGKKKKRNNKHKKPKGGFHLNRS